MTFRTDELKQHLGFELPMRFIICIFHPETAFPEKHSKHCLQELLHALKQTVNDDDNNLHVVFMGSNADSSSDILGNIVKAFVKEDKRFLYIVNLARRHFVSLVKLSACVVGNSSAGLLEVPALKVPSVNVGNRQKGRERPTSVINVEADFKSISHGIHEALTQNRENIYSCYPVINTSSTILSCLDSIPDFSSLLVKPFSPIVPISDVVIR